MFQTLLNCSHGLRKCSEIRICNPERDQPGRNAKLKLTIPFNGIGIHTIPNLIKIVFHFVPPPLKGFMFHFSGKPGPGSLKKYHLF